MKKHLGLLMTCSLFFIISGCLGEKELPTNWPVSKNLIPKKATITESIYKNESWFITFRMNIGTKEYIELVEEVLADSKYRLLEGELSSKISTYVNNEYISSDGEYLIIVRTDDGSNYGISVIRNEVSDKALWDSATSIE